MSIETTAPEGATTPETMKPELEPLAEQTARADSLAVELDTVRAQLAAAQAQLDVLGSELETKLAASAAAVASGRGGACRGPKRAQQALLASGPGPRGRQDRAGQVELLAVPFELATIIPVRLAEGLAWSRGEIDDYAMVAAYAAGPGPRCIYFANLPNKRAWRSVPAQMAALAPGAVHVIFQTVHPVVMRVGQGVRLGAGARRERPGAIRYERGGGPSDTSRVNTCDLPVTVDAWRAYGTIAQKSPAASGVTKLPVVAEKDLLRVPRLQGRLGGVLPLGQVIRDKAVPGGVGGPGDARGARDALHPLEHVAGGFRRQGEPAGQVGLDCDQPAGSGLGDPGGHFEAAGRQVDRFGGKGVGLGRPEPGKVAQGQVTGNAGVLPPGFGQDAPDLGRGVNAWGIRFLRVGWSMPAAGLAWQYPRLMAK